MSSAEHREAVFVSRRLPKAVMNRLSDECDVTCWPDAAAIDREALLGAVKGKRAVITLLTEYVDDEFLEAAGTDLLVVANYAVGVDNIDLKACTDRSVLVANTPDVLTESTADMAWALMLAAARRLAEGDAMLRSGEPWIWGPELMLGQDVYGKTLGIVGFGRIGQAVARRAHGFGMRVVCHTRTPGARDLGVIEPMDLRDLLRISDFVSLHVNLSDQTRHLIDAEHIAMMKPTAVLVNTSRGPVIDEEALAEALEAGVIFAAGLDVFEWEPLVSERLLRTRRAVLSPHLGSATVETRIQMGMVAVENVISALKGERPPNLVNEAAWLTRRPAR